MGDMRNTEPKTQRPDSRKKRRMEITQTDTEIEETLEGKKEVEQKPSKGREEVKPLDVATENTATTVAEELERLKDQHRLQMEEQQLKSEKTLERIKKNLEEQMEKDKSDMAKQVKEIEETLEGKKEVEQKP